MAARNSPPAMSRTYPGVQPSLPSPPAAPFAHPGKGRSHVIALAKKIARRTSQIRQFERELAKATPLIDGRETRRVSRAIAFSPDRFRKLADGEVPFEPRQTYPRRALEWARG